MNLRFFKCLPLHQLAEVLTITLGPCCVFTPPVFPNKQILLWTTVTHILAVVSTTWPNFQPNFFFSRHCWQTSGVPTGPETKNTPGTGGGLERGPDFFFHSVTPLVCQWHGRWMAPPAGQSRLSKTNESRTHQSEIGRPCRPWGGGGSE